MPKKTQTTKRQQQATPCTCDEPGCMARESPEVQKRVRDYIRAFSISKTKFLKRKIPEQLLVHCCINCRFAGAHICRTECFGGVYGADNLE